MLRSPDSGTCKTGFWPLTKHFTTSVLFPSPHPVVSCGENGVLLRRVSVFCFYKGDFPHCRPVGTRLYPLPPRLCYRFFIQPQEVMLAPTLSVAGSWYPSHPPVFPKLDRCSVSSDFWAQATNKEFHPPAACQIAPH